MLSGFSIPFLFIISICLIILLIRLLLLLHLLLLLLPLLLLLLHLLLLLLLLLLHAAAATVAAAVVIVCYCSCVSVFVVSAVVVHGGIVGSLLLQLAFFVLHSIFIIRFIAAFIIDILARCIVLVRLVLLGFMLLNTFVSKNYS